MKPSACEGSLAKIVSGLSSLGPFPPGVWPPYPEESIPIHFPSAFAIRGSADPSRMNA
jgi:hypothetical protein